MQVCIQCVALLPCPLRSALPLPRLEIADCGEGSVYLIVPPFLTTQQKHICVHIFVQLYPPPNPHKNNSHILKEAILTEGLWLTLLCMFT